LGVGPPGGADGDLAAGAVPLADAVGAVRHPEAAASAQASAPESLDVLEQPARMEGPLAEQVEGPGAVVGGAAVGLDVPRVAATQTGIVVEPAAEHVLHGRDEGVVEEPLLG